MTVTTITAYVEGDSNRYRQPGFYERFRALIIEFGGPASSLIAIDEASDD